MLSDDSFEDNDDDEGEEDDQNELVLGVDDQATESTQSGNWHMLSIDVGQVNPVVDDQAVSSTRTLDTTTLLSASYVVSPPPKPARTFEHDLYVSKEEEEARFNRTLDPQDFLTVDSDGESIRPAAPPGKYVEHIYETLPSIDQLSLEKSSPKLTNFRRLNFTKPNEHDDDLEAKKMTTNKNNHVSNLLII